MSRLRAILLALTAATGALLLPGLAAAQPAPLPEAASADRFADFAPMLGKTWRGKGTGPNQVEDVQRWERAVGGHAVRITHAVNGGVYGGETLIFRDADSGRFIFHYFTTGGFHTTGFITPRGPGRFDIEEAVHGAASVEVLRSTGDLVDGVYRTRSRVEKDGQWVESGGFDYREDPSAEVVLPITPRP